METRLITKYRILNLAHEPTTMGHSAHWAFKSLPEGDYHDFDSMEAAHEWIADNAEAMIRYGDFTIVPVYHMVMA